jgi:hypothetical protein
MGTNIHGITYLPMGFIPSGVSLCKPFHSPEDEKRAYYNKMQESIRKDVEWCFGVLRWGIIANPSRLWSSSIMVDIMYACIIMHNMIIENESSEQNLEPLFEVEAPTGIRKPLPFETLVARTMQLENIEQHYSLRGDLVKHL